MKLLLLTLVLTLSFSVTGFSQRVIKGDGSDFKESRSVSGFHSVGLAVDAEVIVVKGNSPGISIEGEKNVIEELITEVDNNNRLSIRFPERPEVRCTKPLRIRITAPMLSGVWNSGSGSVRSTDLFKSDTMSFHNSGSGSIDLNMDAGLVEIAISGSGELKLKGSSRRMECSISGSGEMHGNDLTITDHSKVRISGSGSCTITTNGAIEGRISGSGGINYNGDPSTLDVTHSGSGRAHRIS